MSLIHNGTGTDSFVKSPAESYTNRLLAKIAELEKEQVVLKKFIDLQGEVVKASDAEITEKDKRIAELEAVAEDLISNSSFSINFPFEHDNLEKLRGK
jgi:hypothetical protein